jgi:hypothetical protein
MGEHVFLYCERGTDAALFAEPINAFSNLAFLFAALIALQLLLWRPREQQSGDHFLLIGLVFLIGLGSLAFHLFATRGTAMADVIPISVFMLVYLGFALNRFLLVPPAWTVLLVIGFAALVALSGQVRCAEGLVGFPGPAAEGFKPCLNGSVFYLPALAAMILVGLLVWEGGHRAAPYVLAAAAVFAVSVTLRSLDVALCDQVIFADRKVGTHFAWHLLNALTLFLLLRASFEAVPQAMAPVLLPPPDEGRDTAPKVEAAIAPAPEMAAEDEAREAEPEEGLPAEPEPSADEEPEPEEPKPEEPEPEEPEPKEPKPKKTFFPA